MGMIVDLSTERQKKNQKDLKDAYHTFNVAVSRFREKCPLEEANETAHPWIGHAQDLLSKLFIVKNKVDQKLNDGIDKK